MIGAPRRNRAGGPRHRPRRWRTAAERPDRLARLPRLGRVRPGVRRTGRGRRRPRDRLDRPSGGPTELYISRGAGHWGPPVRFAAPSELTRVILRAG